MRAKLIPIIFLTFLVCSYSLGQKPERIIEKGVEVVVNGPKPYLVKGQPSALSLHEEFRIDLEDDKIAALGLGDISRVDLDSKGRIYVAQSGWPGKRGDLVYVFDAGGHFLMSFGRIGQGPGELGSTFYLDINAQDELPIFDRSGSRILFFDSAGRVTKTKSTPRGSFLMPQMGMYLLENGNLFAYYWSRDLAGPLQRVYGRLFGPDLNKIKDFVEYDVSKPVEEYDNIFVVKPVSIVSKTAIYIAQPVFGNDIAVYDCNGRLIQKIRMPISLIEMTSDHHTEMLSTFPKGDKQIQSIKFPKFFPPFMRLFTDDRDRLYVAGFEEERSTGSIVCDVFTPDGVRILRTGIGYLDLSHYLLGSQFYDVVIKNNRLCCVRNKASGFKEIVVFSMRWF
jgi:hypothetical protein